MSAVASEGRLFGVHRPGGCYQHSPGRWFVGLSRRSEQNPRRISRPEPIRPPERRRRSAHAARQPERKRLAVDRRQAAASWPSGTSSLSAGPDLQADRSARSPFAVVAWSVATERRWRLWSPNTADDATRGLWTILESQPRPRAVSSLGRNPTLSATMRPPTRLGTPNERPSV